MVTKDKKNIHNGHRQRLREVVESANIINVSQIQQIEYVLTYILPRGDVNPLAHALIKRYKNLSNMINASEADLCKVEGINKTSAQKIRGLKNIILLFNLSKLEQKISLKNYSEFFDLLERLLRFESVEYMYLLALNHKHEIVGHRCLNMNNIRTVGISPFEILEFANSTKFAHLVLAHNHPGGTGLPSEEDIEGTKRIKEFLEAMGSSLFDSFIVADDGIYSINQDSFVRRYDDSIVAFK